MSQKNKPNEIYITRVYDAPVKTVWEAWTDPKQKAKWWGPRGFTITTHKSDIRTGGTWDYTMHGPDGVDYPNVTKYLEVEKNSHMVYDHGGTHDKPALFRVTVYFKENKGKTTMEMTMALATAEAAEETKKFIKKAGGNSTWDRLAEHFADQAEKNIFVINRSFDAPIKLMYEMFTNPKHLSKWLAPAGAEMTYLKDDIKVHGTSLWRMDSAHGVMHGQAKYLELTPHTRIVYTQQFVDENEKVSRHPMAPTWPETMLTTIVLSEENSGQTRVTITWEPHGKVSAAELAAFSKEKAGMTQGWSGSFDKLETYLTKVL